MANLNKQAESGPASWGRKEKTEKKNERKNERKNGRMKESMNERMIEWMKERIFHNNCL